MLRVIEGGVGNSGNGSSSPALKSEIPGGVTTEDPSCAKGDSNPHTVKY